MPSPPPLPPPPHGRTRLPRNATAGVFETQLAVVNRMARTSLMNGHDANLQANARFLCVKVGLYTRGGVGSGEGAERGEEGRRENRTEGGREGEARGGRRGGREGRAGAARAGASLVQGRNVSRRIGLRGACLAALSAARLRRHTSDGVDHRNAIAGRRGETWQRGRRQSIGGTTRNNTYAIRTPRPPRHCDVTRSPACLPESR